MKIYLIIVLLVALLCACSPESKNGRFQTIYSENGLIKSYAIILDKETGRKYFCLDIGFGGGITELNETPTE